MFWQHIQDRRHISESVMWDEPVPPLLHTAGPLRELLMPVKSHMLSCSVGNLSCPGLTLGNIAGSQDSWYLLSSFLFLCYFSLFTITLMMLVLISLLPYSGFPFGFFSSILPKKAPTFSLGSLLIEGVPQTLPSLLKPGDQCSIYNRPSGEWLRQEIIPRYTHISHRP